MPKGHLSWRDWAWVPLGWRDETTDRDWVDTGRLGRGQEGVELWSPAQECISGRRKLSAATDQLKGWRFECHFWRWHGWSWKNSINGVRGKVWPKKGMGEGKWSRGSKYRPLFQESAVKEEGGRTLQGLCSQRSAHSHDRETMHVSCGGTATEENWRWKKSERGEMWRGQGTSGGSGPESSHQERRLSTCHRSWWLEPYPGFLLAASMFSGKSEIKSSAETWAQRVMQEGDSTSYMEGLPEFNWDLWEWVKMCMTAGCVYSTWRQRSKLNVGFSQIFSLGGTGYGQSFLL